VSPSQTFVIGSSLSSLELHSRSFTTPFNILKSQSHRGLCLADSVGALFVEHDASRILMLFLIHCGIFNCPYGPKSGMRDATMKIHVFPLQIGTIIIDKI
jgi:hypothetical protein